MKKRKALYYKAFRYDKSRFSIELFEKRDSFTYR